MHFIASDAHNITPKTFYMKKAYRRKLEKEFNKQKAQQFKQITKDLINGELITTNPPRRVKQLKFLGLF